MTDRPNILFLMSDQHRFDLAGLETPPVLDSRSLLPLLEGHGSKWDNEVISQMGRQHLMIKRDALKYQFYGQDIPEVLFDLDKDPGETRNFIDAPEYAEVVAAFCRRRAPFLP